MISTISPKTKFDFRLFGNSSGQKMKHRPRTITGKKSENRQIKYK